VSLGETNTAAPLLDALLAKGYQIWLTNTTQTGFARAAQRFADDIAQGRLTHSYVPVDSPAVIDKFLSHVQPMAALFIETELWANILTKLSIQQIPSILVNGRLSASSFKSYQKIESVSASMMQNLTLIIAQDDESAKRFRQLGALSSQIRVAGSLKWVINTPKPVATNMQVEQESTNSMTLKGLNRPIWIAASTHAGEESIALAWQQQLLSDLKLANTLLIIVPRHPERFDEVAELIKATNLTMARRSLDEPITAQTQVYLADTMGELMHWYEQADVALVGGSLVDIGGHNPVEPASVATPVLMGQYTQSCQSVVDKLAEVGALYQPNNEFYQDHQQLLSQNSKNDALQKTSKSQSSNTSKSANSLDQAKMYSQLQLWLSDLSAAKRAGQAGAQLTSEQQAVLTQQLEMIETVISQSLQGVTGREVL
jgi:3-deoxy-D-manno-octulosonic-acid transferase